MHTLADDALLSGLNPAQREAVLSLRRVALTSRAATNQYSAHSTHSAGIAQR